MPIYDYICPNDHTHSERRDFGDHVQTCPQCGRPVRQVFHAPAVFYRRFGYREYSPEDSVGGEAMKKEICVSD